MTETEPSPATPAQKTHTQIVSEAKGRLIDAVKAAVEDGSSVVSVSTSDLGILINHSAYYERQFGNGVTDINEYLANALRLTHTGIDMQAQVMRQVLAGMKGVSREFNAESNNYNRKLRRALKRNNG